MKRFVQISAGDVVVVAILGFDLVEYGDLVEPASVSSRSATSSRAVSLGK